MKNGKIQQNQASQHKQQHRMGKTINLLQLSQKNYVHIEGLPQKIVDSLGKLEDAFDMIVYGASGNGKSNFTAVLIKALIKCLDCKAHYIALEEGHAMTVQETFIHRHNFLHELGNVMQITDHCTFDELVKMMGRKQSPKIWVIDSLQATNFTKDQCDLLKRKFVLSKKRKILIYISWSAGKTPQGSVAIAVEYYANIKVFVEKLVAFPKSRYGGNQPFVINEELARKKWGDDFNKVVYGTKTKPKPKTKSPKKEIHNSTEAVEPVTKMQFAKEEKPLFKEPLNEN